MTAQQLSLPLTARRARPRDQPPIERLRAVLTRRGIDWRYRATRGSILFRPMFGPHFGWQLMCGFYACQAVDFERLAYRDHRPQAGPDRQDVLAFLAARREAINDLWGRP